MVQSDIDVMIRELHDTGMADFASDLEFILTKLNNAIDELATDAIRARMQS